MTDIEPQKKRVTITLSIQTWQELALPPWRRAFWRAIRKVRQESDRAVIAQCLHMRVDE